MLDSVVLLLEEVGLELAEVSGAGADGGGFDLDAEDIGAVGDADPSAALIVGMTNLGWVGEPSKSNVESGGRGHPPYT